MNNRIAIIAAGVATALASGAKASVTVHDEIEPDVTSEFPDRLSVEPNSRYYTSVGSYVGVKLEGEIVEQVVEFCISEGWIRKGKKGMTLADAAAAPKIRGKVEAFWRMQPSRQIRRQLARIG